jgi:hypothetical protein
MTAFNAYASNFEFYPRNLDSTPRQQEPKARLGDSRCARRSRYYLVSACMRYYHSMRGFALLLIASHCASSCKLAEPTVKVATKRAEIVFSGAIVEVRESEIVFSVDRVWKGQISSRIEMPRIMSSAPCMPGFYQDWVKQGAKFLVYARHMPSLNTDGYVPGAGSRTQLIEDASVDLKQLGRGRPPSK